MTDNKEVYQLWEVLHRGGNEELWRMRIPNLGWVLKSMVVWQEKISTSLVFVPDPTWKWS